MITVSDLIDLLSELDQDLYVVTASDPEGNDYHVLSVDHTLGALTLASSRSIELVDDDASSSPEVLDCVVLYPGYPDPSLFGPVEADALDPDAEESDD